MALTLAGAGGLSSSCLLNWIVGLTDDLVPGGSSLVWRYHHQVGHHPYCNDPHMDQDVYSSFPFMRLDATQVKDQLESVTDETDKDRDTHTGRDALH